MENYFFASDKRFLKLIDRISNEIDYNATMGKRGEIDFEVLMGKYAVGIVADILSETEVRIVDVWNAMDYDDDCSTLRASLKAYYASFAYHYLLEHLIYHSKPHIV